MLFVIILDVGGQVVKFRREAPITQCPGRHKHRVGAQAGYGMPLRELFNDEVM